MKILIDCCLISAEMRGMGVYLWNILPAISRIPNSSFLLVTNNHSGYSKLKNMFGGYPNVEVKIAKAPQPLYEQILLPIIAFSNKPDLYISSGNTSSLLRISDKQVSLIHDVYYLKDKENSSEANSFKRMIGRFYRKLTISISAKRSIQVITVSEFARADIIEELGIDRRLVSVVPNGIDVPVRREFLTKESRLLFVSGSDRQKNLHGILPKLLSNSDVRAKFTSIDVVGVNNAAELGIADDDLMVFHGYCEYDFVQNLYRYCSHFMIPSLYESFGIPAIEALVSGCRVVSTNRGALPEVLSGNAIYFDPLSVDSVEKMVKELLHSESLTNEECLLQMDFASRYSWDNARDAFCTVIDTIG